MDALTLSPKLVGSEPTLINTETELYVSMPLMNVGTDHALNVFITDFQIRGTSRLSPQIFPVYVGNLTVGNNGATNARFSSINLIEGKKYLLTVRGYYSQASETVGFAVNRYITIPVSVDYPVELLKAHIQATIEPSSWNYTIYNDEPKGSSQNIAGFSLTIATPVIVTGTPPNWIVESDNTTYVTWFSTDENPPYSNHVRPGESLEGFQIKSQNPTELSESTPYVLTAWREDTNEAGLVYSDVVASPRRTL